MLVFYCLNSVSASDNVDVNNITNVYDNSDDYTGNSATNFDENTPIYEAPLLLNDTSRDNQTNLSSEESYFLKEFSSIYNIDSFSQNTLHLLRNEDCKNYDDLLLSMYHIKMNDWGDLEQIHLEKGNQCISKLQSCNSNGVNEACIKIIINEGDYNIPLLNSCLWKGKYLFTPPK